MSSLTLADSILLDDIPFDIDFPLLLKTLRLKPGSPHASQVSQLACQAQQIARPKALYRLSFVDPLGEDSVQIDNQVFTSRVLRVNLDQVHRVFPYVATCGTELAEWSRSIQDMLARFWVDTLMEMALWSAGQALRKDLEERYQPGRTAAMHPGSLEDWPLSAQPSLFALLGDPFESIGVRLTGSLLMIPTKSVSGFYFPTEQSFESCQLCPREICRSRKAPYDPSLYEKKYAIKAT